MEPPLPDDPDDIERPYPTGTSLAHEGDELLPPLPDGTEVVRKRRRRGRRRGRGRGEPGAPEAADYPGAPEGPGARHPGASGRGERRSQGDEVAPWPVDHSLDPAHEGLAPMASAPLEYPGDPLLTEAPGEGGAVADETGGRRRRRRGRGRGRDGRAAPKDEGTFRAEAAGDRREPRTEGRAEGPSEAEAPGREGAKRRRRGSRGGRGRAREQGARGEAAGPLGVEQIPFEEDDLPIVEVPAPKVREDEGDSEGRRAPPRRESVARESGGRKRQDRARPAAEVREAAPPVVQRKNVILVNAADREEVRVAVVENHQIVDFQMTVRKQKLLVNDIYRGRVVNLEPAIGAAFVDFGQGRNGFLHTSDVLSVYGEKDFTLQKLLTAKVDPEEWGSEEAGADTEPAAPPRREPAEAHADASQDTSSPGLPDGVEESADLVDEHHEMHLAEAMRQARAEEEAREEHAESDHHEDLLAFVHDEVHTDLDGVHSEDAPLDVHGDGHQDSHGEGFGGLDDEDHGAGELEPHEQDGPSSSAAGSGLDGDRTSSFPEAEATSAGYSSARGADSGPPGDSGATEGGEFSASGAREGEAGGERGETRGRRSLRKTRGAARAVGHGRSRRGADAGRGGGNRHGAPGQNGGRRQARPRRPITELLEKGQVVVVQITKDAIGEKGPTLTTYISIPGRHLVLMPSMARTGVSRKIEDEKERRRLKKILASLDNLQPGMGVIVRTAGIGCSREDLQRDLDYLLALWGDFEKRLNLGRGPAPLYEESDVAIRTVRDLFNASTEAVIVDDPEVFQRVREFTSRLMTPEDLERIQLHDGARPLFHAYGVEQDFERIFSRRIELPSGGSIVFDQTEALVAIDVNSGKTRSDGFEFEEIALKTNLEAAPEIARQIRLRDLGGIIVCDFIDMQRASSRKAVERALAQALAQDRARSKLGRISQFGLLELTRQRLGPGLSKMLFHNCTRCRGSGRVCTVESRTGSILRRLGAALPQKGFAKVEVRAAQDVIEYLRANCGSEIKDLEGRHQKQITLVSVSDQMEDAVLRYLRPDGREVRPGGRRKR
ncbi:MAG: Rne/Rng family ribonuclease [Planctomycetes bacterium]|nr:Rne/Rng family ribonuclease [Planctomycetota bacterium]